MGKSPSISTLFLSALLLLGSGYSLRGQFVRFRHLTTDQGLSQNAVTCIAQDKKGFIWIGTYDGLNRYDGFEIKQFRHAPEDSNCISGSAVKAIHPDNMNRLWIGTTGGGLSMLDMVNGKFTAYMEDSTRKNWISSNNVHCIRELQSGKLFLGTSKGLNIFDLGSQTFSVIKKDEKIPDGLPANFIKECCMDKNGKLWLAQGFEGLTRLDLKTGKCRRFLHKPGEPSINENNVRSVMTDSRGWIWVSCWNGGINVINPETEEIFSSRDTLSFLKYIPYASLVSQFFEDSKGNIWICTAEHGIICYNPKTHQSKIYEHNPNEPESLSDNTAFAITADHSGLIWSGTWKGGVNIFDPKILRFGFYKHEAGNEKSLKNNNVFGFCENGPDEILLATSANVSVFHPRKNEFSPFPSNENEAESVKHNSILYAIEKYTDGSLFMASSGAGLYRYFPDKKKYRRYITGGPGTLSYHTPTCMVLDKKGRLWIGTGGGGMNLYNDETDDFTVFPADEKNKTSLPENHITNLLLRPDGKIWIGTASSGLVLLDPEARTFKRFFDDPADRSLPDRGIGGLYIDRKGRFWVGTSAGPCQVNENTKSVKTFSRLHPFFKSEVVAIAEDNSGNLWMSSNAGLCRFNPETEEFKVFGREAGIQGMEFCGRSVLKTHGGKLFFGGINGFNYFLPEDIKHNQVPPRVALTGFTVLNKPRQLPGSITYADELFLTWKDYFFSLDFACLDFTNIPRNTFAYKLEGFNDDWVNIGNQHSVTFTNLDPGDYHLLIRAANNDGVWCQDPIQLRLHIAPPFWRTGWFYSLCGISLLLGIYLYIKFREKKLRKEKEKLEEKVEERTAELQVEKQKVEIAHKDIRDSIFYAQKIQSAILPGEEEFRKHFSDYFILFRPKDIVSGDFFWVSELKNADGSHSVFYATADCTGHGVPGGFMTMLGHGLLNEIVNEKKITGPAQVLNLLREKIITSLKQTGRTGENKDGMDIVLCRLDKSTNRLTYAAANNSFMVVRGSERFEMRPDKQPVGIYGEDRKPFTQRSFDLASGDMIFTFTDGYADQFGGPKGKKFKYRKLEEKLSASASLPVQQQKDALEIAFEEWKGNLEQIDDVLVIGIRI